MKGKRNLIFIVGGVVIFLLFVLFSYIVHKNHFTQFDFNTTVKFQNHISQKFNAPFSYLSEVGKVEFVSIFLIILLLILRKMKGIFVLFLFGLLHVFELYGKTFVDHFPPPHFMLRTINLLPEDPFYVRTVNSYPSGHSARALFITGIIAILTARSKKFIRIQKVFIYIILCCYDIAMLTSRIYLGEHWTTDVIGGSLLGLSFALFAGLFLV